MCVCVCLMCVHQTAPTASPTRAPSTIASTLRTVTTSMVPTSTTTDSLSTPTGIFIGTEAQSQEQSNALLGVSTTTAGAIGGVMLLVLAIAVAVFVRSSQKLGAAQKLTMDSYLESPSYSMSAPISTAMS
eukprot:m.896711 g.896711  ORF g.896711 m.896711 type:complete len:130 (-) comp23667_c0_seq11:61-450(-)